MNTATLTRTPSARGPRLLTRTLASEWSKLWSVRSTWWCLASAAVLMVLSTLTLGGAHSTDIANHNVPEKTFEASEAVVSATTFVQFALIAMAMLVITSEYGSGLIRATFQATPVRGRVLAAKAMVLAPVMFVAGVVTGGIATAVEYLLLSLDAFGGSIRVTPAGTVADLCTTGVYFALVSLLTVGLGAAMRSAAGTLTAAFMLVMGLPLTLAMSGSQVALDISMRMPMFAGLAFMGSTDNLTGGRIPYSSAEGLAWLVAWAVLGLVAGHIVLRRRDA
ncbi:ABC transporter permease [Phytomonospora endophytica]|uniref:ABC-2 type transport system permease protein n=1 Tax=Phytomonospora endophytica TaxID=714109 RepID=A0A841FB03_9ACTN|nr:ABC transporter permease [Phytomonospora endophytica]MBB6032213.1 ABC-2 type transport system permease protein [Phytomonospora endophytica]GIG68562.1 ABC transporter permease [Phytomonospora endophytica]